MEMRADRRLSELAHAEMNVAVYLASQGFTVSEFAAQGCGVHSEGRTRALHYSALWRYIGVEHKGNPQHPLVSDETNLEGGRISSRHEERHETAGGEINAVEGLPRRVKHIGKREFNRFTACQNASPLGNWERREQ